MAFHHISPQKWQNIAGFDRIRHFRYLREYLVMGITISLAACNNPPPVTSVPPAEWTTPVAEPTVPVLPEKPTQAEVDGAAADYITRLWDAFQAAQNKLKRLDEWRAKVSE